MRKPVQNSVAVLALIPIAIATIVLAYRHGQSGAWVATFTVFSYISATFGLKVIAEASEGFVTNATLTSLKIWTVILLGAAFLLGRKRFTNATDFFNFWFFLWLCVGVAVLGVFAVVTRNYAVYRTRGENSDTPPRQWSPGAHKRCQLILVLWFALGLLIPPNAHSLIGWFDATGQSATAASARQALGVSN